MIFHQLVDVWDLRQLEQAVRCAPSPTASPPLGRTFPHKQTEGLLSRVPRCHVDPALPPSSSVLQRRATLHLGRKFLQPKARSYFKQAHVFGQKPNSVSQTHLTVQAVPSSELGHLPRMPEGTPGQQHPAPFPSPTLQLRPKQAQPVLRGTRLRHVPSHLRIPQEIFSKSHLLVCSSYSSGAEAGASGEEKLLRCVEAGE